MPPHSLRMLVGPLVASALVFFVASGRCVAQERCDGVPTFADGVAPAREVHVAPPPRGDNGSGDGSAARPYATIAHAAARATPGTAVRVHAGTYAGGAFLTDLRGRADAPIWIGGAPGDARPVIDGGSEGLHLSRARYVVVHDLEIRHTSANGVNSDDAGEYANADAAHHQVFRSLLIHDVGDKGNQDGLKLSGVRHFVVLDCEVARCGGNMSGSGIDMVGCHQGVIARCAFNDLSANAVQAKGGTADVHITRCRMVNAGERALNIGGSTGAAYFRPPLSDDEPNAEARRIRATANVIVGGAAAVAFVGAVDCAFVHNTVVDPRRWAVRILQETVSSPDHEFLACSRNTVSGNIFYFERAAIGTDVNVGANTAPESFAFARNLWYAHDNPGASRPRLPSAERDGMAGEDPRFVDAGARDFRVRSASPGVGRGVSPVPTASDAAGDCFRDPPTIGAYEAPASRGVDGSRD